MTSTAATSSSGNTSTTTTTATGNEPWYNGISGVDQEIIGHFTSKGWDKKTPQEVAVLAAKAHREAEKFVGAPANELLRLPKDATDEAGWNNVWKRLGKPADAKEYDFSNIKFSDGAPLNEQFANLMRENAYKLNLPKDTAVQLTEQLAKFMESADSNEQAEMTAKLAAEKSELAKNWGPNFEANKFVAQRTAAALGVDPETVAALEKQVGYAKVMEMFRNIGSKIGEDKFVRATGGDPNGVMSKDMAVARLAELKADKAWVAKFNAGDAEANRQMKALIQITTGFSG